MKKSSTLRRRGILGVCVAVLAAGSTGFAPTASADSVPFTDADASGYIGFCDKAGHQIRSGNIGDAPYVYHAVASQPAPTGYTKATLFLYQPRKDVDPGDWSGKQMTAAAQFTNRAHPMAAGTGLDPAFVDFSGAFPLRWDGYAQARLFYTTPGRPMSSRPYPAAIMKLSGNTWTQVGGGTVPCTAGTATSIELQALPSSILARPTARTTLGATPSSAGIASPGRGRSTTSARGSAAPTGVPSTSGSSHGSSSDANSAAADPIDASPVSAHTTNDAAGWTVGLLLAAAVAVAGAVVVIRRRRAG